MVYSARHGIWKWRIQDVVDGYTCRNGGTMSEDYEL
jgi:hypothetical protein